MTRVLITGGAGFIGSNLADRLEAQGLEVVIYDNFSTGRKQFLDRLVASPRTTVVQGDILDKELLVESLAGCDLVFHLAANADVRFGLEAPDRDLQQNAVATLTVLEAMRARGVKRIVFASSGSVYGEPAVFPTPEDCPFPVQTSLYGASKVAAEGLIQAYYEGFGFGGIILRFVSILGERYTHGHLFDFYRALRRDPENLTVLGDGRQRKSYLYVGDCIAAIQLLIEAHEGPGSWVYNLGTDEVTSVDWSVQKVCEHMGVNPRITHTGGKRGWIGDSPLIHLDCSRIRSHGWEPTHSIADAVDRTLRWFDDNPWVFDADDVS
jgi:UDP-glucose 4-epimerase